MLHLGLPSVEGGLMSEFLNRTCGLMAGGAAGLGLRSAGWCLLFQSGARLAGLPGHVCRAGAHFHLVRAVLVGGAQATQAYTGGGRRAGVKEWGQE